MKGGKIFCQMVLDQLHSQSFIVVVTTITCPQTLARLIPQQKYHLVLGNQNMALQRGVGISTVSSRLAWPVSKIKKTNQTKTKTKKEPTIVFCCGFIQAACKGQRTKADRKQILLQILGKRRAWSLRPKLLHKYSNSQQNLGRDISISHFRFLLRDKFCHVVKARLKLNTILLPLKH